MTKKLPALLAIALALTGCNKEQDTPWTRLQAAAPQLSLSTNTPDSTVKSWWQARDARVNFSARVCVEMRDLYGPVDQALISLAAGTISNDFADPERCAPTVYSRDITKVDIQSDTRAIVQAHVRNATPPSKGYTMDEDDKQQKGKGRRMQYLLERQDAQQPWKITQVYSSDRYCVHDSVDGWCVLYKDDRGTANDYVQEYSQ